MKVARTTGVYRRSAVSVKAMWRYATRRASKQKRRLLRFRVTNSTVMKLRGSDNRGGIIVKTYKEHLLTFFVIRVCVCQCVCVCVRACVRACV